MSDDICITPDLVDMIITNKITPQQMKYSLYCKFFNEEFIMRILHTMIRVTNLEASIKFYTNVLGMKLIRQKEYPEGKFTLAFVGYGSEADESVIELTYNWDTHQYETGNAFGHIAIEVDDVYQACASMKKSGGEIIRDAGPMNAGKTIIAFIKDPDGYEIELIGKKS